ncbi:iron ABC transporter substrate-binding protein [Corynebacterium felinum]|uniref:Iron(III) transport system substrate-binding protein n=1 Tax=Corynebacterium felinum TaxID=131318 RepID=A0ABU2BC85_9CORY|nr:iron ABC transporter substrate-binding protein [Corynebacterium felinum]MDF5821313.1 iron ABC transporter substrate-binding protein [Corynebacterium felinum]MDR7354994.1 iron(III) transport system substrate-binding protein [Corynebacterium felinum]WJY94348.1 Iron-utilization periplasmic protein precursor [Corynebacterium felinum]
MRSPYRFLLASTASVALVGGLTACSNSDTSSTSATTSAADSAQKQSSDDTLVIYSGRSEDLVAPLIEMFEEKTGIKTEVRYGKTAEQAQLLLTEGEKSPAEVFFSQEAGALGLVGDADLLAPLPAEVFESVPANFSSSEKKWVGVTGRARVVAYNKDKVQESDAPDTIDALVDPKWAEQIGVAPGNASFLSFVTAMRVEKGDDFTREWLQKLVDNKVKTYEKNTGILEAVNSGEISLGLINHYYWYLDAAEKGAENMTAQLKFGKPGDLASLVNVTGVGVTKKAEKDPQALEFVKFLLSEDAQKYFATETYEYPLVASVSAPEGVPAMDPTSNPDFDLSKLSSVDETAAMIDEVGLTFTK